MNRIKEFFNSRIGIFATASFFTLIAFVVVWCSLTTFRSMSDWMLWAFNLLAAALLTLPFVLTRRIWVMAIVLTVADAAIVANLMYCRTYFCAIPAESYLMGGNLADFIPSVVDSARPVDMVFPIITLIAVILALRAKEDFPGSRSRLRFLAATAALAALCTAGIAARGGFYKALDRMAQSCYNSQGTLPTYTLAGNLVYRAMAAHSKATPESKEAIGQWLAEKDAIRPFVALPDSTARRRSVVIVLLESFESWLIGAEIQGKEITPVLNSLVRRTGSLYFPNMATQTAHGRSIDAQLLLTCGLMPMWQGVWSMKQPDAEYPSLPRALRAIRQGRSYILTCDKPMTWNQHAVTKAMGYDSLLHASSWHTDQLVGNPPKLSDGSFLRQAAGRLDSLWPADSARLITIVTYSGHNPWRLPEGLKDAGFMPHGFPEKFTDYVTTAHYTDASLKPLIDYLDSRPDRDSTLVLITGDHEGLANYRRELTADAASGKYVSPQQFTPMLLLNAPVAGCDSTVMGQIDLYPTLLSMLGLEEYHWKGQGQNVAASGRVPVAIVSMTGEVLGDTTGVTAAQLSNIKSARIVSDMMIGLLP